MLKDLGIFFVGIFFYHCEKFGHILHILHAFYTISGEIVS